MLSTPSLGITYRPIVYLDNDNRKPFNSLSRDHESLPQWQLSSEPVELSTPSLGITSQTFGEIQVANSDPFNSLSRDHFPSRTPMPNPPALRFFQLPLSGSLRLAPRAGRGPELRRCFQLPLSGSHDYIVEGTISLRTMAFNSLSRDHASDWPLIVRQKMAQLSTPSLGITEPDSGIFRLSAASCRGAPSHK